MTVEITPRYHHTKCRRTHVLADPTRYCVELIPDWFDSLPAGLTERVAYAPTFADAQRVARQFMRSYDIRQR